MKKGMVIGLVMIFILCSSYVGAEHTLNGVWQGWFRWELYEQPDYCWWIILMKSETTGFFKDSYGFEGPVVFWGGTVRIIYRVGCRPTYIGSLTPDGQEMAGTMKCKIGYPYVGTWGANKYYKGFQEVPETYKSPACP